MIRKASSRTIRKSASFFHVTLGPTTHDMRVPNQIRLVEFIAAVAGRKSLGEDASPSDRMLHQAEAMRLVGAALGLCWYSTTHQLESLLGVGGLHAYGMDVWDELHESGFSSKEIDEAGGVAFEALMAAVKVPSIEEVEDRATFSKATRGL